SFSETILRRLRNGAASFELVSSPAASVSAHRTRISPLFASLSDRGSRFFARLAPSLGSPALKKVERYSVRKVIGDGRCLFRALVRGMALNKGVALSAREETENADELRMAVKEVICDNGQERAHHQEALIAITVDESLKRYCQRIGSPDFWGGEAELLVLSKLCRQPVIVYIPENEQGGGWGYGGFIPIQEYGSEFRKRSETSKPVRLLYSGKNHYDLL
ncbi:hypothetical protein M569_13046, partial [Genlisea aurea]